MTTRKSFDGIHEDYRFFSGHSTEGAALREAMMPLLSEGMARGQVRWLDFGCGSGMFLRGLLETLGRPPSATELALVDVDPGYLEEARRTLSPLSAAISCAMTPGDLEGSFDLITSKHALYYVKDLPATVRSLCDMLTPGGRALLVLGGEENHLSGLWETAYAARNLPVPYYRAQDVARVIDDAGHRRRIHHVPSLVRFPDSRENRLKMLRFLFAGNAAGIEPESLLNLLDPMKQGGEIVIRSVSWLFEVTRS